MKERPTVLLTGATDGIGRQTARELSARGVRLIAHGRESSKLAELVRELAHLPGPVQTIEADLGDMDAIRSMMERLAHRLTSPLDVVINNAGVYMPTNRRGPQGFELTLTINYLAPALLSHLAVPLQRRSTGARIINVASVAHERGNIEWNDLNLEGCFEPDRAYSQAKLALVMFTRELARRLGPSGPVAVSLHPGIAATKLLAVRGIEPRETLRASAATAVHLALLPISELRELSGGYFVNCRPVDPDPRAMAPESAERLYEWTCRSLGIDGLSCS